MNCKNCGEEVNGRFCSNCGQSTKVGKIDLSNFLKDLSNTIFQVDKGFFYTFKELFKRPGISINEFLNGKRKSHFKPITYVLTLSTVYFLASRLSGKNTWMNDLIYTFSASVMDSGNATEMPFILTWLTTNFAYANLFLLPIFSFASFLCFSGKGRNYLEHIVLNAYITGQQAFIYTLFFIPKLFINDPYFLELIPFVLSIAYCLWVYCQFFTKGKKVSIIIRSVLTYSVYFVISVIVFFTVLTFDILLTK